MMDAKNALVEANGDMDARMELLRVRMGSKIGKLAGREAAEGTVQSYIHANGKVGVLVEVDCNTTSSRRNDDFIAFAKDVALHVAASPQVRWVSDEQVPEDARQAGAARLRAAGRGRGQAGEHPRADRRGQAQEVARRRRPAQAAARPRREARRQDDRGPPRRPLGQDRRERGDPALHAVRRR
jgi:translation elongation factor EF-Ts